MTTVRYRAEVVDDLSAASAWYERRRSGFGDAFLTSVERCVESIASTPRLHAVVHREVRRALVPRFPYAVYFVEKGAEVLVVAILHVRRDPETWRTRE